MNLAWLWNWFSRNQTDSPASLGKRGEAKAVKFLKKLGYRVLARSERNRCGELDIVMRDGDVVVFVEVKTRESDLKGSPEEAVTAEKQQRISRAAALFIKRHRLMNYSCRFDVVAILWPQGQRPTIKHIKNAFDSSF